MCVPQIWSRTCSEFILLTHVSKEYRNNRGRRVGFWLVKLLFFLQRVKITAGYDMSGKIESKQGKQPRRLASHHTPAQSQVLVYHTLGMGRPGLRVSFRGLQMLSGTHRTSFLLAVLVCRRLVFCLIQSNKRVFRAKDVSRDSGVEKLAS